MRALPTAILLLATLPALADEWPELAFRQVLSGLNAPTHVTSAGDGSGRLFVVQQSGQIRVVKNGQLLPTPYLDLTSKVSCCGERGLLSIAFEFSYFSRRVYVDYTDKNGDTVIARYRPVNQGDDVVDARTEEVLLTIPQPYANHNGGQLAFGPGGYRYLYVGMGDGGSGGDPQNRAQDRTSLLGKILRIDVSPSEGYTIPPSNPYVNAAPFRPEIWAYGLRNPWRFSFDRLTRDLFIGDVGQGAWEEIDVQPVASSGGENYGWRLREGNHCYNPSSGCPSSGLTPPVVEYSHSDGCSVTGGFIYRGSLYPRLYGVYLYGDYCSGRIWGLRRRNGQWESRLLVKTSYAISTFGEDEAGELYVADAATGRIYQITDAAGLGSAQMLPILLDVNGKNGARFTSDLTLTNTGTTPVRVVMTYTAAEALGATGSGTVEETLAPGRQLVEADALAYLRGKGLAIPEGPGQGGTLRLVLSGLSSPGVAGALARTTTPSGPGRAGLASPFNDVLLSPQTAWLIGLRENAQDRTNLAIAHAGLESPITLQITLYPPTGDPTPLAPIELRPGEWRQLDSVLSAAGLTEGLASVTRTSGSDPFVAYAVINDNATGDGSYVGHGGGDYMPAVESPSYETELVVASPVPQAAWLLGYAESLPTSGGPMLPYIDHVSSRQRTYPGILDFLRLKGLPLSPRGGTNAGVLFAADYEQGAGVVASYSGARVTTRSAGGGRYGVYCRAIPLTRKRALVMGLRQDAEARSNLGVINGDDLPASFHVEVFDGATGALAGTLDLPPLTRTGWTQVDGILGRFGVTQGYVRVSAGGKRFIAYGVVNDGAAPGLGTGDGSFVEMSVVE